MFSFTPFLLVITSLWMISGNPAIPDGFGRFGRFHDDGLLTLNVTPFDFETPSPLNGLKIAYLADGAGVELVSIDSTHKTLRVTGGGEGAPEFLHYTLLYPGFAASFQTRAVFRISGREIKVEEIASSDGFSGLLITAAKGRFMPILLAFRKNYRPATWKATKTGGVYLLEINGDGKIGMIRIVTPLGMEEFPAGATASEKNALLETAEKWASRGVPILVKRGYSYDSEKQSVTVTEDFTTSEGECIAPLSPVLSFALENGYPATLQSGVEPAGIITKYGPLSFVPGNTLVYTLPLPPLEERGYIRREGNQDRVRFLNSLVGHLGGDWAKNGVDLGYAGMSNAQMAWAWLDSTQRQNLTLAWKTWLPMALRMPPYPAGYERDTWKEETEPLTRKDYVWTYSLSGPPPGNYRLDIDWGNALPLYGLYKYAQYTGDWDMVRKNWGDVKRIYRYFDLGDDWAWMTVVNGDMGWSTGTGDPMAASFCGNLACLKMARALMLAGDEAYFAYKTARISVPTVTRFHLNAWARKHGFIPQNGLVQGFWERETFTCAVMDEWSRDPWGAANILSGDGILPELYNALTHFARPALETYEAEIERYYPHWAMGDFSYSFSTTYNGNSIYVTFPHIFARAVLGETTADLWKYVESAKTNRGSAYWVGPNVVAEILSRETPFILTEWQPAAYVDGFLSSDGKTASLSFRLNEETGWNLEARFRESFHPGKVKVNGEELPFQFDSGLFRLSLRTGGTFTVEIDVADD